MFGLSLDGIGVGIKYAVIGVIAIAIIGTGYYFKNSIKQAVYDEVFREQVEKEIKQKDDQISKLKKEIELRDKTIAENQKAKEEITRRFYLLRKQIADLAIKDGELAPVLILALKQLQQLIANNNTKPIPGKEPIKGK